MSVTPHHNILTVNGQNITLSGGYGMYADSAFDCMMNGESKPFFNFGFPHQVIDQKSLACAIHAVLDHLAKTFDPSLVPEKLSEIHEALLRKNFQSYDGTIVGKIVAEENYLVAGFCILLAVQGMDLNSSTTRKIAKVHYERFIKFSPVTGVEAEKFLDPFAMRMGEDQWEFFNFFKGAKTVDTSTNTVRDHVHLMYCALDESVGPNTLLNDVEIKPLSSMIFDPIRFAKATSLPIDHKKFRDFLYGIKVCDIQRLFGRVKKSGATGESIKVSQLIIFHQLEPVAESADELALAAHEAYSAAFRNCYKLLPLKVLDDVNSMFMLSHKNHGTIGFLRAAFENFDTCFIGDNRSPDEVRLLVDYILISQKNFRGAGSVDWIEKTPLADPIVELLAHSVSPKELLGIFSEVRAVDLTLSVIHWLRLIEDPHLLVSPVSWWKSLM